MPIAKHLRHLYTAAAGWPAKRAAALTRAGGTLSARGRYTGGARCEQCGKPDRARVWVVFSDAGQFWSNDTVAEEIDRLADDGCPHDGPHPELRWTACLTGAVVELELPAVARRIRVVISVAHLNHVAGDDRAENLVAICQYHHCMLDLDQHADTRKDRKDGKRRILAEVA